jgi:hypothetical protein
MKRRKAVTANIFTMGVVVLAIALYFSDHRKEVAMGAALGVVIGISAVLRATCERIEQQKEQS